MGGKRPQEDPTFLAFIHCSPRNPWNCDFILNGAIWGRLQRVGHDWATELNWTEVGGSLWFCGYKICSSFWARHNHCKITVGVLIFVFQSLSRVWLFVTPWTAAHQASLTFTISWSLLRLISIELVIPFKPSRPLSSPSPPTFNLS